MDIFIAWDGDRIGRKVGRLALADDEEGLRRVSRDIERGNAAFSAWVAEKGGSVISAGGDEGRARVPAEALEDLPAARRKYRQLVEADASVGVGVRLSQADRALLASKLRGGDRVTFYTDEVAQELAEAEKKGRTEEEKLFDQYLGKAEPPPPPEPESTAPPGSPAGGGGFVERPPAGGGDAGSAPPPSPGPFDGGEVEQEGESDPGPTSAEAEDELHQHAQVGAQQDDAAAAAQGDLEATKRKVVEVLQQVRQQAPKLEEIRQVDPALYEALQGVVGSLVLTARALVGQGGAQPQEQPQPVAKAEQPSKPGSDLPSEPGYAYHATNEERAHGIAREGLLTHRPHEFTDQQTWPDGSDEQRNYFTPHARHAWQFAPEEGHAVVLRLAVSKHPLSTESTGDLYSTARVPPEHLEILTGNGWNPIKQWSTQKAELPLPENGPTKHILHLPVGATKGGRIKVRHGDGRTGWVSVRAGQVLADDGHAVSSRNPGGR